MKILVTDPVIARFQDELEAAGGSGTQCVHVHHSRQPDVIHELRDTDVFVGGAFAKEYGAAARQLKLVHLPGVGYDGIDFAGLPAGTLVANTHHHGRSVAEHIVMCILALSRRLLASDRALRRDEWASAFHSPDVPLYSTLRGRMVGLLGLGEIGTEVVRLLSAFGMRACVVRRSPDQAWPSDLDLEWVGGIDQLDQLLRESNVLVVALPLTAQTHGLIGPERLAMMRRGSLLVNVARGPIVDETALYDALEQGHIGGAALDVWWKYPTDSATQSPSALPFGDLSNVIMTPHSSGNTTDTYQSRVEDIAANIARLTAGQPLSNVIEHSTAPKSA